MILIQEDSIMFNLSHENDESAKIIINKIYLNGDEVFQQLKSEVHIQTKITNE